MFLFSVGYSDKDRIELSLLGTPDRDEFARALVQIEVGAFKGELEVELGLGEMARFKDDVERVYENVAGVAEFMTLESELFIRIDIDKLGHVEASGYLRDGFGAGNKLNFIIRYDQTLLWHTISEIDEALFELFPKRG